MVKSIMSFCFMANSNLVGQDRDSGELFVVMEE